MYYLLSTKAVKYDIANRAYGGANQVNVSPKDIKKIKWDFPTIDIQEKISKILSTYDELIENNNKRIKLLEQMAENLYKEWFVRFRFPNHENTEFENGIPKGWEIKKLFDVLDEYQMAIKNGINTKYERQNLESGCKNQRYSQQQDKHFHYGRMR